jgi:hypothetical protein
LHEEPRSPLPRFRLLSSSLAYLHGQKCIEIVAQDSRHIALLRRTLAGTFVVVPALRGIAECHRCSSGRKAGSGRQGCRRQPCDGAIARSLPQARLRFPGGQTGERSPRYRARSPAQPLICRSLGRR